MALPKAQEKVLDESFDEHPLPDFGDSSWTISLGTESWKKPFLMLCIFETLPSGALGWVNYGRIDVFRRGDDILNMLITTKETSTLIAVDVERFSGTAARCYLVDDIEGIVLAVKNLSAKQNYEEIARLIAGFVFEHHASTLKSAIQKSKEILRRGVEKSSARPPRSGGSMGPSIGLSESRPSSGPAGKVVASQISGG